MSKGKLKDLVVDRYVNLDLFYSKQQPDATTGCVNWTGVKQNIGYGFIAWRSTDPTKHKNNREGHGMMTAHRLAWMIKHQRLPTLRNINHTCHNKLCVNTDHLVEGTQQEKLAAMSKDGIKGGRQVGQKVGSYNHKQYNRKYKYTDEEIQWVRFATTDEIAKHYNITKKRAASMRGMFRKGFEWLPYDKNKIVKLKPGKPKGSKKSV